MAGEFQFGATFYNQSAKGLPSHPWVIISDPDQDPDNVLIVNLTDADTHDDHSCVLNPEDSPHVKKRSCIAYRHAKVTSIAALVQIDGI